MNLEVLSHIDKIRVRVCEERGTAEKRRKKKRMKNEKSGSKPLLYVYVGRVDPRPGPLSPPSQPLIEIQMDLDQSNAPGALA